MQTMERTTTPAETLTRLMVEACLLPAAQDALRKTYRLATNDHGMIEAVNVERCRMQNVRERFKPNFNVWLNGCAK